MQSNWPRWKTASWWGREWRTTNGLLRCVFVLTIGVFPHHGYAPPPPPSEPDLPGTTRGKFQTYWIAPYVHYLEESIGRNQKKTVTWYSDDKPIKSLSVDNVQPGFVSVIENGQKVIVGINEDWKLVLPVKANPHDIMADSYITGTRNSHVFVHQSCFDGQHISEDIYVGGQLQPEIGPFLRYLGREFAVGEDGSTCGIVWKDAAKTTTQLVVTDATGKLSFRVECEQSYGSPIPAPNGIGALMPGRGGTDQDNFFGWYTGEGKRWAMQVAPNPYCIGWIPATQKSLFSTSLGYEARYRMIDWADGRERWDIACPGGGYSLAIGITPRLIVFEVAELYHPGPWRGDGRLLEKNGKEWIRTFYAVNADDGHIVSHWRAYYATRLENYYRDKIVLLGKKLYYVSADEFVELSEDDILNGRNGWEQ